MNRKINLLLICVLLSLSAMAQRYVTPTSDLIIDVNFLERTLTSNSPINMQSLDGNLPGLYFSYHKNAPFGRTYLQANYNTGDLEGTVNSSHNLNVDQINISLGYAHHIAQYYPACKIMNPFLLGLIVKADMMTAVDPVNSLELYGNTYSADILLGHDLNFNSQNRIELTFYMPLISYYTVGEYQQDITEIENSEKYIGSGETSLLFDGRKAFGGNIVYHLYFTDSFGVNLRYNFEKDDYENPIIIETLDHQLSAGIVLHFDQGYR